MTPELKQDRPSYVRFERRAVENRTKSIAAGHYVADDVDFAIITPHGSKDRFERVATEWLDYLADQVRQERLPLEWYERYKKTYEAYKRGEEMPLQGTPIKGWQLLSPAQQQNLIALNIMTVEDLAGINESAKAMIGLGAVELQKKALNWLEQANGAGKLVARLTAVETDIKVLQQQHETDQRLIQELRNENARLKTAKVAA